MAKLNEPAAVVLAPEASETVAGGAVGTAALLAGAELAAPDEPLPTLVGAAPDELEPPDDDWDDEPDDDWDDDWELPELPELPVQAATPNSAAAVVTATTIFPVE